MRGRIFSLGAAAVAAAVAGCGLTTSPSPTAAALPSPTRVAVTATPPPSALETLEALDPASVELHLLDARFVPAGAPVSAGGEVVWAAGNPSPSEIWRFSPGEAEPERIFASPRVGATITAVTASDAGYAFVEISKPEFGRGGWRVWYLPGPGAEPVLLDAGVARWAGSLPTISMDEDRVAWAGFDEPPGVGAAEALRRGVSRIAVASRDDPPVVTTLLELPVRKRLLWYPALHGDELWYGLIRADVGPADPEHYHIEMLDLANPGAAPIQFAEPGLVFNPAVTDRFVVWKANEIGDAALNWGTITVLDRASDAVRTVPVEHANNPSAGDRFIAFDEITHSRLILYDTTTGDILDLGAAHRDELGDGVLFGGQSVSGRVLSFLFQDATSPTPMIGWAILPE